MKHEKSKPENSVKKHPVIERDLANYWNNIADDVATGYGASDNRKSKLNEDQQPGDNERGDV